ncbi:MAG: GntR family transcriptional regulator [Acidobacteria bacterium]|nr:GntR family transcriptional regulator [Acidobacteriota bacterium]MCG2816192.1 GntR family transcriptional regulator [Candidatus Aminicenantes bacterium]MBU4204069.1 GntR family transcriptional regulator [Acidobacteriota bacterium]MBU4253913.1 GntR family transcriptional regulator [Acidobacteriota bacterium]MBU4330846.1 GntR family transcriptional regulator [Acidobacteriota bacterium]
MNPLPNIIINPKSAVPVYEQIKSSIRFAILSGKLKKDDKLMSLRDLSLKLKINPNTTLKVYYQLEVEGYVYSRPGSGYYVKTSSKGILNKRQIAIEKLTEDYLSKAVQLGNSLDDIIKVIKQTHEEKFKLKGGE